MPDDARGDTDRASLSHLQMRADSRRHNDNSRVLACERDDLLYSNALKGALMLFNTSMMPSPLTINTPIMKQRLFNSDFSIKVYLLH
jgi:hypothetical protein